MVLLIDNYDSFSYNLVQLIGELTDGNIKVVRNDEITIDEIRKMNPESIILSPGPGKPEDAGICEEVVRQLKGEYPILGVCLGHQSICEVFGAKVTYAKQLMHGKQSDMTILKKILFLKEWEIVLKEQDIILFQQIEIQFKSTGSNSH